MEATLPCPPGPALGLSGLAGAGADQRQVVMSSVFQEPKDQEWEGGGQATFPGPA